MQLHIYKSNYISGKLYQTSTYWFHRFKFVAVWCQMHVVTATWCHTSNLDNRQPIYLNLLLAVANSKYPHHMLDVNA